MVVRWLWLMALLFCSCPRAAEVRGDTAAHAKLVYGQGRLSIVRAGSPAIVIPANKPVPYAIIAQGPPMLVTTCGTDLRPVTFAAVAPPVAYPDTVPLLCDPPLVALMPLPDMETFEPVGCTLLKPDGAVQWQSQACELLTADCGVRVSDVAYIAMAQDGSALTPFGAPRLVAIDTASGAELWRSDLAARDDTVDVHLWALDDQHGLLSLQYNYESYDFVTFDRLTGGLGARHSLSGQPAIRLVYPGPAEEPSQAQLTGGIARILMFPLAGRAEVWSFNLASGELAQAKLAGEIPAPGREENTLPVGGNGAPGPAQPPFPQTLLPTQSGDNWSIPALLDETGRVLVVDAGGARWVQLEAQGSGS